MTIPPKVIELAISGGWDSFFSQGFTFNSRGLFDVDTDFTSYEEIALDPLFFQALGKSLGWDDTTGFYADFQSKKYNQVGVYAHTFYDLILTNQPTDTFWEEILAQ